MIKLTIGIPTYNRETKVLQLLKFLHQELFDFYEKDCIEIIVSDNCSTDNTYRLLCDVQNSHSLCYNFILNKNKTNEGIIGNQIVLHNLANGNYVWIMGDDDIYHEGIIKHVYAEINKNEYSFIFINHCIYSRYIGDNSYIPSMLDGVDINRTDKNVLLDITEKYGTPLMYISATIHKKRHIKELFDKKWKVNLAYPLLMSFYSASMGKTKLIEEVLIEDVCGEISWSNLQQQVFYVDVPYVFRKLGLLGYDKSWRDFYKEYIRKLGFYPSWWSIIRSFMASPRHTFRRICNNPHLLDYPIL